ncbi:MAG: hypothetical protein E6J34_08480 [Chloroflexi bacterium]|nr:MAG: hypothetical protein E6J34_08480 [Chloroflexota bacterium]
MSLATKRLSVQQSAQSSLRRIWRAPTSNARWLWLAISVVLFLMILVWYFVALKTQQFPSAFNDPLRLFGIIAFMLVLGTATYTLRRRFVRGLPGKVQNWLWMHTWIGIITILIALMHENFVYITHGFLASIGGLLDTYWGPLALFSLLFLVVSGIVGRLLDMWQSHIIAYEASTNGVGIERALKEKILEMEYIIERLSAGKSEPFKQYCLEFLGSDQADLDPDLKLPLKESEQADFQRAFKTLQTRAGFMLSLQRQQKARRIINWWRSVHMVLATLALIVIFFHGFMELLVNVFHLVKGV